MRYQSALQPDTRGECSLALVFAQIVSKYFRPKQDLDLSYLQFVAFNYKIPVLILLGPIAQLGERLHGMQEVSGSIPLGSIRLASLAHGGPVWRRSLSRRSFSGVGLFAAHSAVVLTETVTAVR